VIRHNGAIIKTIGDAVMATFLEPADAVAAALSMRNEIDTFNGKQADRALILKIGIHKGAAIAVTLNERLDYFGQTVNIAARVQQLADAEEIFVSEDVYSAEGVHALPYFPGSRIKRLQAKGHSAEPARVPYRQGPGGFVSQPRFVLGARHDPIFRHSGRAPFAAVSFLRLKQTSCNEAPSRLTTSTT
jgi:class 3 adenylate cyclase